MRGLPVGEASTLIADLGGGFLPGEEVAVAIIGEHIPAGSDGGLDAAVLTQLVGGRPLGCVVLIGRMSGNLVIGLE
jgi:hypothetical protein